MPNIPTRERYSGSQNQPPRQPQHSSQQTRPTQGRPSGQPQGRVQVQQMRYGQNPQIRTLTPPPSAERLRPMKPSSSGTKKASTAQQKHHSTKRRKKSRRQRERTTLGDFLLSFFVALFVFGVAAIFVCNALISLFT